MTLPGAMTSTALFSYLRLVAELLHRRAVQATTEDEEENFGIKLNDFWEQMNAEERVQAEAPCPLITSGVYASHSAIPVKLLAFIGEQEDAPGYPPTWLYNCVCGTTLLRVQEGRCDTCNLPLHAGPCD